MICVLLVPGYGVQLYSFSVHVPHLTSTMYQCELANDAPVPGEPVPGTWVPVYSDLLLLSFICYCKPRYLLGLHDHLSKVVVYLYGEYFIYLQLYTRHTYLPKQCTRQHSILKIIFNINSDATRNTY